MNKNTLKKVLIATLGSITIMAITVPIISATNKRIKEQNEIKRLEQWEFERNKRAEEMIEKAKLEEKKRKAKLEEAEKAERQRIQKLKREMEEERKKEEEYEGLTESEIFHKKWQKEQADRMNQALDREYGRKTERYYDFETDKYYDAESYHQLQQVRKDLKRIYNEYGLND